MDFKDFCNTKDSLKNDSYKKVVNDKNKKNKEEKLNKESVEEKINKYSTLSENELMQEFLKESVKAKQSGVFDENKISQIKNTLYPYLTDEQKDNFDKLIGMVK